MKPRKLKEGVFWVGAHDYDRRLFDSLIPLPDGTSYNAYLICGSEKTVLLDTVDPSMLDIFKSRLQDVGNIDFIISHHSEQDHSGAISFVLGKYKNAKVVTSPKGKQLLAEHLHIAEDRIITVNDGETLSLGNKTLEFIHAPWVHWPETMFTYLREDKIMFTCDLFGAHLAASDLFYSDYGKIYEPAKRYYAEIMMPFRTSIQRHIEKLEKYQFDIIAPSHGPVHKEPKDIIQSYKEWVSDINSNTVVIVYVSMHGSTQLMAEYLAEVLSEKKVNVEKFNLTVTDAGKLAMALIDAATIVIGSPTVLMGAHPAVITSVFMTNALKPKLKFASIIGSYGWGGRMNEQITGMLTNLKLEIIEPVIIKGLPKDVDYRSLDRLADAIKTKHRMSNIIMMQ